MFMKHKIITLCGSTRFKDDFARVRKQLTLAGHIVLGPEVFGHSGDCITPAEKRELDHLHKVKIAMADEIFVINKNGYIGESTLNEIRYAQLEGKVVRYMEDEQ